MQYGQYLTTAPLLLLFTSILEKLWIAQTDGLRVIPGALRWSRLSNLWMESGLPSRHHCILARTTATGAKLLKIRPHSPMSVELRQAFQQPPNATHDLDWVLCAADATRYLGVNHLFLIGPDLPHPDFSPPPPLDSVSHRT